MSRRPRRKAAPFIMLQKWMLRTPAWRDLDPVARALYVELRDRYNGANNGLIGLGVREAGEALNVGRNVANRAFKSLEAHGFIRRAAPSSFMQKRLAIEWLLTEEGDDRTGHMASKDFVRWSATVPPAGLSKQKPVPPAGHIVPPAGLCGIELPQNITNSPTSGTVEQISTGPQSHQRDTSRYTTPPSSDERPAQRATTRRRSKPGASARARLDGFPVGGKPQDSGPTLVGASAREMLDRIKGGRGVAK